MKTSTPKVEIKAPQYPKETPTYPTLSEEERERTNELVNKIGSGFYWEKSMEGKAFWNSVYTRLVQLAEGGPMTGPDVKRISVPNKPSPAVDTPRTVKFKYTKEQQKAAIIAHAALLDIRADYGTPEEYTFWRGACEDLSARIRDTFPIAPEIEKVNEKQRTICRKASSLLMDAFTWDDTEEGGEFWSSFDDRLRQIATNGLL